MSYELAVLLFVGNAILFWLWSTQLLPLFQSVLKDTRGQCPHCGLSRESAAERGAAGAPGNADRPRLSV